MNNIIYKKIQILTLVVFIIISLISSMSCQDLNKVKKLYERESYLKAVEILKDTKPVTDEVIYWLWKCEIQIGFSTNVYDKGPYMDYIKKNEKYFYHSEDLGPEYRVHHNLRFKEIQEINRKSKYLPEVWYYTIAFDFESPFEEGGDLKSNAAKLIERQEIEYKSLISSFPDSDYAEKAKEAIKILEEVKEEYNL